MTRPRTWSLPPNRVSFPGTVSQHVWVVLTAPGDGAGVGAGVGLAVAAGATRPRPRLARCRRVRAVHAGHDGRGHDDHGEDRHGQRAAGVTGLLRGDGGEMHAVHCTPPQSGGGDTSTRMGQGVVDRRRCRPVRCRDGPVLELIERAARRNRLRGSRRVLPGDDAPGVRLERGAGASAPRSAAGTLPCRPGCRASRRSRRPAGRRSSGGRGPPGARASNRRKPCSSSSRSTMAVAWSQPTGPSAGVIGQTHAVQRRARRASR